MPLLLPLSAPLVMVSGEGEHVAKCDRVPSLVVPATATGGVHLPTDWGGMT
jgi:hypothetical protein